MLGLFVAVWGLDLLKRIANMPELAPAHIDGSVLGFVALMAFLCGTLFGLFPAFKASQTNFQDALNGAIRTRQLLVLAEVALAFVLLIGCARIAARSGFFARPAVL